MSTITVTNIKATGQTASRAVSGVAAAWAKVDGTGTAAILDSVNFSSLTDTGTGNYSLTVTNLFSSANISTTAGQFADAGGTNAIFASNTTTIVLQFFSASNVITDAINLSALAHGDLA